MNSNLALIYAQFLDRNFVVIAACTLLLAGLAGSGLRLKPQSTSNDQVKLNTPINAYANYEHATVVEKWPFDEHRYIYSTAYLSVHYTCHVIITLKDKSNILTPSSLGFLKQWNDYVVKEISVESDISGESYSYSDLCLKFESRCTSKNKIVNVVEYFFSDRSHKGINISYPTWYVNGNTTKFHVGEFFGGITLNPDKSAIETATAIRFVYFLEKYDSFLPSWKWQKAFRDFVKRSFIDNETSIFDVAYAHSKSIDQAIGDENQLAVAPKIGISAILLTVVAILLCLKFIKVNQKWCYDHVATKTILVDVGVTVPSLAVTASMGLWLYLGGQFVGTMDILPFLIIGIGLDDSFIFMTAWLGTERSHPTVTRMAETIQDSVIPITITSFTTCVCFLVGAASGATKSIVSFCLVATLTVAVDFLLQLFLFGTCLFLSGVVEKQGMANVPLYFSSYSKNEGTYGASINGESHPLYDYKDPNEPPDQVSAKLAFCRSYANFLKSTLGRFAAVLSYCLFIGSAIGGLLQLKEGMDLTKLGPYGHHMNKFYKYTNDYMYLYGQTVDIIVNNAPNISYHAERVKLENMVRAFEDSPVTVGRNGTSFFLRDFEQYLKNAQYKTLPPNSEEWETLLLAWSKISSVRITAEKNLYWSRKPTGDDREFVYYLKAFRFQIGMYHFNTTAQQQHVCNRLRELAENFPEFNVSTYHREWPWIDQYNLVRHIAVSSIGQAIGCMALTAAIFFRSVEGTLTSFLASVSTNFGIVGYMAFANVDLDFTAAIVIVMSIGFSIDYIFHTVHGFVSSAGSDTERIAQSLAKMGIPIFQGALTTICGLIPLGFVNSYVPYVFFSITILSIVLGMYHAVVILPLMLSFADYWGNIVKSCFPCRNRYM